MEIEIYKSTGKGSGKKAKLSDDVFAIEPNDHAIYLDVKQHMANKRQGTHKAKERAEVKGSTRKIKKQKGTGTARAGDIKNPLFKGGGRVFGPRPRNYSFKVNKKVKRLARKSALSYKAKESNLTVLEDINFDSPKTKQYVDMLGGLEANDKKTLLVIAEGNQNIILSARNIPNAKVTLASSLNTYDILNANKLLVTESSIKAIEEILK